MNQRQNSLKLQELAKQAYNEVLRVLDRLENTNDARILRLSREYGASVSQVARYIELFGDIDTAEVFLNTNEKNVIKTIRVNTLKTTRTKLAKMLESKGFKLKPYKPTPYGLIVEYEPIPIGATHEYLLGLYTVQGPASMLAVLALKPEGAKAVLDCCAGAGGKSTQIAQHTRAPVFAVDTSPRKLLALKNHASRLGILNIIAVHGDARRLVHELKGFSHALVDAPCSGEGLWPFPWGRWPRKPVDIASRVQLQIELLGNVIEASEPGTIIVYSTCTVTVEENEYVVSKMLEHYGNLVLEDPEVPGDPGVTDYLGYKLDPSVRLCRRLYPHKHRTEGFTICRIRVA